MGSSDQRGGDDMIGVNATISITFCENKRNGGKILDYERSGK
jgi:hypothetical protein